jgi:hypothetical protein
MGAGGEDTAVASDFRRPRTTEDQEE